MMRTVYNGYSFDHRSPTTIYNPTLSLYFLDHFQKFGGDPDNLLDENMAMDRNKLLDIAKLPHGEEVIVQALDRDGTLTVNQLARRFGVEDMLYGIKDRTFMVSLLYYFGILTLSGVTGFNEKILKIPNLVAKKLYVERLQEQFLPEYEDKEAIRQVSRHFCQHGDLEPLCAFIERRYFKVLSNRDYAFSNELMIKIAFLTLLFNDHLYLIVSETEVDHRYADLSLIVRPDMRRFEALDLLLEFKFLGLKALSLTGEQLRGMGCGELAELPRVAKKLDEAEVQAETYGGELSRRYGVPIRCYAVVALGFERLVWREVS